MLKKLRNDYLIEHNNGFLNWYKDAIGKNYMPIMDTSDIQQMINKIAWFYKVRYQDDFNKTMLKTDMDYEYNTTLYNYNLLYNELTDKERVIFNGFYRETKPIQKTKNEKLLLIKFSLIKQNKEKKYFLKLNKTTGEIYNTDILGFSKSENILASNLANFLKIVNNMSSEELLEIENNHVYDIKLRDRILFFAMIEVFYTMKDKDLAKLIVKRMCTDFKTIFTNFNYRESDIKNYILK